MTNYEFRALEERDRAWICWMDELTETWGDESKPLDDDYAATREQYVNQWDESQGGVILEATSLDDADIDAFSNDIARKDPFDPGFDRVAAFSASAILSRSSVVQTSAGDEALRIPVGAAWLRTFTADARGWGYVADEYPEVAIALRPGAVGRRLSTKLISGLLDNARELGYPGVSLSVEDGNNRARKSYVNMGFVRIGRSHAPDHDVMLYKF